MTTVSTADALWAALKVAKPGDTILLAGGSFGHQSLTGFNFAAPGVTIAPAPGAAPVFNNIEISSCSGLHFGAGIEVFIADPTQHNASYGVYGLSSHDISLTGLKIHGKAVKPAGGVGVFFRGCAGPLSVDGCEFYDLGVGVGQMDSTGLTVSGGNFHDLCTDGIDNAGATDTTITGNHFTDFYPTPDAHPDAIQFWGTPTNPRSSGARISDNVIRRGLTHTVNPDGSPNPALLPPQGIFAQETDNLTITGNAMAGTMFNGISISDGKTSTIGGNFVQAFADMGSRIIVRDGAQDITISGNTISDKPVDLVQATDAPNLRITIAADNVAIATAAVGDTSAMDGWLAAKGAAQPPPVTASPPPPQPVVTPAPTPTPDPAPIPDPANLAIIMDLKGQVATLQTKATADEATIADLTAQIQTATAGLQAAHDQAVTLQEQLSASQVTAAADEALLGQIRSTLRAALGS